LQERDEHGGVKTENLSWPRACRSAWLRRDVSSCDVGEADSGDDDEQDESEDREKGEEPDAADVDEGDEA
jgi:hypothetical protein